MSDVLATVNTILAQCIVAANQCAQYVVQMKALLSSVQPTPTSSVFPAGSLSFVKNGSGSAVADGGTVDGASLTLQSLVSDAWVSGPAQQGTWINVSGITIGDGDTGWFYRKQPEA